MNHFRKIFWGLLVANAMAPPAGETAYFRGLGYLLLALGAGGLAPLWRQMRWAAALSWVALGWSLASVWLGDLLATAGPVVGDDPVVFTGRTLIQCALTWALLGGIAEYAAGHGRLDLARRASHCRAPYVVLALVAIWLQFADGQPHGDQRPAWWAVFSVPWVIWLLVVLDLVHRVRREVASGDEEFRVRANRPWQYSLRTLLLAPVALWFLMLAFFPKLVTGDFCNVRIDRFSVEDRGQGRYDIHLSYSTRHVKRHVPARGESA